MENETKGFKLCIFVKVTNNKRHKIELLQFEIGELKEKIDISDPVIKEIKNIIKQIRQISSPLVDLHFNFLTIKKEENYVSTLWEPFSSKNKRYRLNYETNEINRLR